MKLLSARTASLSHTVCIALYATVWSAAKGIRVSDPIIFKGLKSLTLADTQQQSLLRLALEGISVRDDLPEVIGHSSGSHTIL